MTCAQGNGVPDKDTDGCYICKTCTCKDGASFSNTCAAKAGYSYITTKEADICNRADKCYRCSYGKSCLNKLAQDDLDNMNTTNLSTKRISTKKDETCPDGYKRVSATVSEDL